MQHFTIEEDGEIISELLVIKAYEKDELIVHPVYSLKHLTDQKNPEPDKEKIYLIDLYYKEDSFIFSINIDNAITQFEKNTEEIEEFREQRRNQRLNTLLNNEN